MVVIRQLSPDMERIFQGLSHQEKLYAHFMSRAAWHGARVIMRQTSPEAVDIFDLILDLYHRCDGRWDKLKGQCEITTSELDAFLEYAALILCNLGNFQASDQF